MCIICTMRITHAHRGEKEAIRFPGSGVTNSCKLPCGAGSWTWVLWKSEWLVLEPPIHLFSTMQTKFFKTQISKIIAGRSWSNLKITMCPIILSERLDMGWRDDLVLKSICCSSRGHTSGSSQVVCLTPASGNLYSGLLRLQYTQAHHIHKNKINLKTTTRKMNFASEQVKYGWENKLIIVEDNVLQTVLHVKGTLVLNCHTQSRNLACQGQSTHCTWSKQRPDSGLTTRKIYTMAWMSTTWWANVKCKWKCQFFSTEKKQKSRFSPQSYPGILIIS